MLPHSCRGSLLIEHVHVILWVSFPCLGVVCKPLDFVAIRRNCLLVASWSSFLVYVGIQRAHIRSVTYINHPSVGEKNVFQWVWQSDIHETHDGFLILNPIETHILMASVSPSRRASLKSGKRLIESWAAGCDFPMKSSTQLWGYLHVWKPSKNKWDNPILGLQGEFWNVLSPWILRDIWYVMEVYPRRSCGWLANVIRRGYVF